MSQPTEQATATRPPAATCTTCASTSDLMPCADCGTLVCPACAVTDEYDEQAWCHPCAEAYLD